MDGRHPDCFNLPVAFDRMSSWREKPMSTNTLVCPFLTDDPVYANGVEFGMLYARMRDAPEDAIQDYFCRANQEQILLLANRLGWTVREIEPWNKHWFWCVIERGEPRLAT
jgi:hypothetical protein